MAGGTRQSTLEFQQDDNNEWRWYYVSSNGRTIGGATESYKRFDAARKSAQLILGCLLIQQQNGEYVPVGRDFRVMVFRAAR